MVPPSLRNASRVLLLTLLATAGCSRRGSVPSTETVRASVPSTEASPPSVPSPEASRASAPSIDVSRGAPPGANPGPSALLARPDDELVSAISNYAYREMGAHRPVTRAERAIEESIYCFAVEAEGGIGSYLHDVHNAQSTRDSLRLVGLEKHAAILDDLLTKFPKGTPPVESPEFAMLQAADERWGALKINPTPTLARYARAHASDLHLEEIAGSTP